MVPGSGSLASKEIAALGDKPPHDGNYKMFWLKYWNYQMFCRLKKSRIEQERQNKLNINEKWNLAVNVHAGGWKSV